jgi:hypothetical protein
VLVAHQLSGAVRIDGVKQDIPLTFDGAVTKGTDTLVDQALMESLVMDTIEGLVYSFRAGGALRLVGRGFGADPRVDPKYEGPHYDIFELLAPVRTRLDRELRLKYFYFDSSTGLLVSTRYTDTTFSPEIKVETRFSNWQQIEGSAFPGRIDRYQNSHLIFSLVVSKASSQPRQAVTKFQ